MLRSTQELRNYAIAATDGEIGHVTDFYCDDGSWVIRYLLVETGSWLMSRKVLTSPSWIDAIRWADSRVSVNLDRKSIKASPIFDSNAALSREHELELYQHYRRSPYWNNEPSRDSTKNHDKFDK